MKYLLITLLIFAGIIALVLSQAGSSSDVKDDESSSFMLGAIDSINGNDKPEDTKQHEFTETKAMNIWALGRINFSLPPQFELVVRNQHMHLVDLNTIALEGRTANELWDEALNSARKEHVASGYKADSVKSYELGLNFMA